MSTTTYPTLAAACWASCCQGRCPYETPCQAPALAPERFHRPRHRSPQGQGGLPLRVRQVGVRLAQGRPRRTAAHVPRRVEPDAGLLLRAPPRRAGDLALRPPGRRRERADCMNILTRLTDWWQGLRTAAPPALPPRAAAPDILV